VRLPYLERRESRRDVLCSPDFRCDDLKTELAGCGLGFAHIQRGVGIANICQYRQPAQTGDNLAQKLELLAGKIGLLVRQASDVAARARQARDQTGPKRVHRHCEDDGNNRCCLLCCDDRASRRNNDIDFEPDELGRDFGITFAASLRPAILDRDGAALDPAALAQPLYESRGRSVLGRSRGHAQVPDDR
jgi:hypothetical protein